MRELGAPIPWNDQEHWGNHHFDEFGWEEYDEFLNLASEKNHFIHPWYIFRWLPWRSTIMTMSNSCRFLCFVVLHYRNHFLIKYFLVWCSSRRICVQCAFSWPPPSGGGTTNALLSHLLCVKSDGFFVEHNFFHALHRRHSLADLIMICIVRKMIVSP